MVVLFALALPIFLVAVATAAVSGFTLLLLAGEVYLRVVGTTNYTRLSLDVIYLLAGVSYTLGTDSASSSSQPLVRTVICTSIATL
ncbi:hypothetical protein B9G49_15695 [Halorubrum sp. SD683]|nr:hypothetical protein B9G49_15695 [Halorubrum sp. SD683]